MSFSRSFFNLDEDEKRVEKAMELCQKAIEIVERRRQEREALRSSIPTKGVRVPTTEIVRGLHAACFIKRLVFLLALLFGVSAAVRPYHLRHGQKISKLSGDALIQAACRGAGDDESDCISTLQSATSDQKADANALALFTLKFVENHAENITTGIKKINAVPDVAPLLQSALTDCMDQYNSLDDLIEDANQGVQSHSYEEAQKFIMAGLSGVDLCDSQLKASKFEEKAENKTGEDFGMARDLIKYNVLHKKLLLAALNILTMD